MKSCTAAHRRPTTGACSDEAWLAEIVTGVPVSEVLLALDTPGST